MMFIGVMRIFERTVPARFVLPAAVLINVRGTTVIRQHRVDRPGKGKVFLAHNMLPSFVGSCSAQLLEFRMRIEYKCRVGKLPCRPAASAVEAEHGKAFLSQAVCKVG